jgi:hypothetical protein
MQNELSLDMFFKEYLVVIKMDSYAEAERLSWNMLLFGAIMIMPNYKKQ